tara:strand:- start:950 stop:1084 length:135 start_codon:yes stop_codon:yes gene_type:complete
MVVKDKNMKEKICKWVKAISFGLVCLEWCIKPDVCEAGDKCCKA